jgi:hypothetical protein
MRHLLVFESDASRLNLIKAGLSGGQAGWGWRSISGMLRWMQAGGSGGGERGRAPWDFPASLRISCVFAIMFLLPEIGFESSQTFNDSYHQ